MDKDKIYQTLQEDSVCSTFSALQTAIKQKRKWNDNACVKKYCNAICKNIYEKFCELIRRSHNNCIPIDMELFFGAHLTNVPSDAVFNDQLRAFSDSFPLESFFLIKALFRLPGVCDGTLHLNDSSLFPQDLWKLFDRFLSMEAEKESDWWQRVVASGVLNYCNSNDIRDWLVIKTKKLESDLHKMNLE